MPKEFDDNPLLGVVRNPDLSDDINKHKDTKIDSKINNNDVKYNNNNYDSLGNNQQDGQFFDDKKGLLGGPKKIKLKNGQEFIEVDRFGQRGKQLSPVMINICTFLYSLVPIGSMVSGIALIWLLFTNYWFITFMYVIYLILNTAARETGGQRFDNNFQSIFWKYLAAYFEVKLRYSTTFKLNPEENYLLNYSPHGISAFGCVSAFATDALDFTSLFPGIKPRFMVHEMVFLTPFMREAFVYRGDCSVSSRSIDYMLNPARGGVGNLLALVAGGLQEADLSDQDTLRIVVKKRKGFIKKALVNGTNLIPTIAFGENSVFTKINLDPSSSLYHLEKMAYKYLGFKHPIYYGYGPMPFKRPITVVMGDPIRVLKVANPSQEQIDLLHKYYITQLERIYEAHEDLRSQYDTTLELI